MKQILKDGDQFLILIEAVKLDPKHRRFWIAQQSPELYRDTCDWLDFFDEHKN